MNSPKIIDQQTLNEFIKKRNYRVHERRRLLRQTFIRRHMSKIVLIAGICSFIFLPNGWWIIAKLLVILFLLFLATLQEDNIQLELMKIRDYKEYIKTVNFLIKSRKDFKFNNEISTKD